MKRFRLQGLLCSAGVLLGGTVPACTPNSTAPRSASSASTDAGSGVVAPTATSAVAPQAAARATNECPPPFDPGFQLWADTTAHVTLLQGASLASDGLSVATEIGPQLVQDTALTATPDCAEGHVFQGFAGIFPKAAWAVRANRAAAHLYRFGGQGWRLDRKLAVSSWRLSSFADGALAAVVSKANAEAGSYEWVGLPNKPAAKPASGSGVCKTRIGHPEALVGTSGGDVAVLGRLCGEAGPKLAIELFRSKPAASAVIALPDGVTDPHLEFDTHAELVLGAMRGTQGIVAKYVGDAWRELPPLAVPVIAIAAGEGQMPWAVTSAPAAGDLCNSGGKQTQGSNLYRWDGTRWVNVALPAGAGKVTQVAVRSPDDIWVATEHALLRTGRPREVLRWAHSGYCPQPVTGAKPYFYQRAPAGRQRGVESVGDLVGSSCNHLILVDSTTEPTSAVFDAVASTIEQASLFRDAMRKSFQDYDAALEAPPRASLGSPTPYVSFELGRFNWGIWAEPLQDAPRVTSLIRDKFPKTLREVCAAPFAIRLDAITRRSVAPPAR